MSVPFVEAHGAKIPQVGLGVMTLKGDVCVQAVRDALQMGYTHVDTAWFYGNEKEVGEGLRQSGVKRENVFITTKVRETHLEPEKFRQSLSESLANLQLPYVDLLLIHWNNKDIPLSVSIPALCAAKKEGKAKHVGVANFTTKMLDEAWGVTSEPLVCNQIEMHPFLDTSKVAAACRKHGMAVVAYSPIARGNSVDDDVLARIGRAHKKSAAQVSLRWLVQQGVVVIPRTSKVERLEENLALFDFALSEFEMAEIGRLARRGSRIVDWTWSPKWD